jgi:hypothetical protein
MRNRRRALLVSGDPAPRGALGQIVHCSKICHAIRQTCANALRAFAQGQHLILIKSPKLIGVPGGCETKLLLFGAEWQLGTSCL